MPAPQSVSIQDLHDRRLEVFGERALRGGFDLSRLRLRRPRYRPRDPAKLAAFFEDRITEYTRHIDAWTREDAVSPAQGAQHAEAIASWRSRIERIRAAARF